ncbi:RNA 2',3'-cyclic phosphodiesterase [Patescibacteria group bacterium]|nr:RNA 2',3'-cyclic phosphodiesterase [Patescibacteria group bacterium]
MDRLFIAISLPLQVKNAVADAQLQIKDQMKNSNVTWVAPENFHVTLHFLGDVEEWEKGHLIIASHEKDYPTAFEMKLTGVSAFPNKKNPRTLFVDTTMHPSLLGVRKRIADVLLEHEFRIDTRKWASHITVGRVKDRAEVLQPEKIKVEPVKFTVVSFDLISSTLGPEGSIYEVVETFPLT